MMPHVINTARRAALAHDWTQTTARLLVAGVWVYHGLWCKLLAQCPTQGAILDRVPHGAAVGVALGVAECALAAWVVSGRAARACVVTQAVLLAGMNTMGLWLAGDLIERPGVMLASNLVLIALAYHGCASREVRDDRH